jgi:hypothetical protein
MASRTFAASVRGAVGLLLRAPVVDVVIVVSPDAVVASADLTGPAVIVDAVESDTIGSQWDLTVLRPPPTVIETSGFTTIMADGTEVMFDRASCTSVELSRPAGSLRLLITLPAGSWRVRTDARHLEIHGELRN